MLFQMLRQFAINLRQRSDTPTEFNGDAYNEEEILIGMNDQLRKMTPVILALVESSWLSYLGTRNA